MVKRDEVINNLRSTLYDIAVEGTSKGCTEYGVYVNRGEKDVVYVPTSKRPLLIMCDLYSAIVNTKTPVQLNTRNCKDEHVPTLDVNPVYIDKVYYHAMQSDTGVMIIGILTSKSEKDNFIIEHVE